MRKLLVTALLLVGTLAALAPPSGAQVASGGRTGYATPTPPSGPQAGEVALGSFVAPTRTRSPLAGHGIAGSWKAGVGCSVQCITGGVAYGRGPDVRLVVTTDTAATIRIVVSRNGYYQQLQSDPGQTRFEVVLDDLDVDTPYDAFVSAVDGAGEMANRSGSFRSLQRNVDVLLTHAEVEATPYGDEPFAQEVWFEGQVGSESWGERVEDGRLALGIIGRHAEDTDRYLDLAVELSQGEPGDNGGVPCEVHDSDVPEAGQFPCDYTHSVYFAGGQLDLDAGSGPGHWNTYVVGADLVAPNAFYSPLRYTVPVTVTVTWTDG